MSPAPVDLVISNVTVVTVDATDTVIDNGAVAVRDGRIVAVGTADDVAGGVGGVGRFVDGGGGIVMPGLVNAHAHLAMTMFRGRADDLDLDGFLGTLLPAEASLLSPSSVATGAAVAMAECLLGGITTTLDMYWFHESAFEVAHRIGFRLCAGPVFMEFDGPDRRPFADRVRWADEQLGARAPQGVGSARWLFPHSTYLLDADQLDQIAALAAAHDTRVHVHAAETRDELAQVRARHGASPIEVLQRHGLLCEGTTLAHGVHLSEHDIDLVAAAGASVTHCPASNLKLASGIAPIRKLVDRGVNVALGTDGPASGNDLDLWLAMRLAGYVQKAVADDPAVLPASRLVRMATMGGAQALGMGDEIGSIENGKRADLVLLDAESPALVPSYSASSSLAYAAGRADVRSVWVDGRLLVEDRRPLTVDVPRANAALRALTRP